MFDADEIMMPLIIGWAAIIIITVVMLIWRF